MTHIFIYKSVFRLIALIGIMLTMTTAAYATTPLATDSRIRTFVYGENDVFRVITRYGYQTNIEFGLGEEIVTLSVGDSVIFRITPAVDRLFIRPMEEDMETNMTVVTNLRTYQFDLSSIKAEANDLMYVIRFYYPENDFDTKPFKKFKPADKKEIGADSVSSESRIPKKPAPGKAGPPNENRPPFPAELTNNAPIPLPGKKPVAPFFSKKFKEKSTFGKKPEKTHNYNYTISGPASIAPLKIFDDDKVTYIKLPPSSQRGYSFFKVMPNGTEVPVKTWKEGEYTVINGLFPKYSMRVNGATTCIFNENMLR